MPNVSFNEEPAFEGNFADFKPDVEPGSVNIDGNPATSSRPKNDLGSILGIDDAEGIKAPHAGKKSDYTADVLEGSPEERLAAEKEELEAELQRLRSQQGQYGREVVGPLRAENQELRQRLEALESKAQDPAANQPAPEQQGPAKPQDLVPLLFGEDADPSDPDNLRVAKAASAILYATDQGTSTYVQQLESKLDKALSVIEGRQELASAGLSMEQVRQAEEAYPELSDLPEKQRYALISRLARQGKSTPPRDNAGRFTSPGSTRDPGLVVDGSSDSFGAVDNKDRADDKATALERFRALGKDPKKGGRAQTQVFMDLVERGYFND